MPHQHLPTVISKLAMFGRHAIDLCHQLVRMVEVGILRWQDSRGLPPGRRSKGMTGGSQSAMKALRRRHFPLLIHYHIFKNAGTSFEWALEQAFGDGFRSFDSSFPGGFISVFDLADFTARNPDVRAISSHQAAPPAPRIHGREVFTSILIRDPIARIRSIYAFERRQQGASPGAIKAKELDFKEYVKWRLQTSPAMLCNYQVHFCSRMPEIRTSAPREQQLREAIANLDTISIVGTVARYEEWLALARNILSAPFPTVNLPSTRQNATARDDSSEAAILEGLITELGEATAQYLLENNELDMRLHQIADALLTRRLAEHGVGLTLHKAYASAQQDRRLSREQTSHPDR